MELKDIINRKEVKFKRYINFNLKYRANHTEFRFESLKKKYPIIFFTQMIFNPTILIRFIGSSLIW